MKLIKLGIFIIASFIYFALVYLTINDPFFISSTNKYFQFEVSTILITLIVILTLKLKLKEGYFNLSDVIVNILKGDSKGVEFLFVFLFVLITTSWASDYLESNSVFKGINSILFLFLGVLLYIDYSINRSKKAEPVRDSPRQTKVLVLALSSINTSKEEKQKLKKATLHERYKYIKNPKNHINMKLPLEVVEFFKDKIKQIIVLVSEKSEKDKELFKEMVNFILKNDAKIKFSDPVDFNDYYEILDEIETHIKKLNRKGYSDEDITIFISSGTSAVTAALVMAAVREGRQVIYYNQEEINPEEKETCNLKSFNISIEDVKRFIRELGFG